MSSRMYATGMVDRVAKVLPREVHAAFSSLGFGAQSVLVCADLNYSRPWSKSTKEPGKVLMSLAVAAAGDHLRLA